MNKHNAVAFGDLLKKASISSNEKSTNKLVEDYQKNSSKVMMHYANTKNKPNANLMQTQCKPNANIMQKPNANLMQTQCKPSTRKNKPNAEPNAHSNANLMQTQCKPNAKQLLSELVGTQKKIMEIISFEAYKTGNRISPKLTFEFLSSASGILSYHSIKSSIARVIKKNLLIKKCYKNGRGGWTQFELPEDIYNATIQSRFWLKSNANLMQTQCKPNAEPNAEPNATPLSSSSDLNINKTTSTRTDKKSREYSDVSIPESFVKAKFGNTQLLQIENETDFSAEDVQITLDNIDYDYTHDKIKVKTNLLNYTMGVFLHKKAVYKSPYREDAIEEDKKNLYKAIDEQKRREKESEEYLFNEWIRPMTREEIESIIPVIGVYLGDTHRKQLKDYFVKSKLESFKKKFTEKVLNNENSENINTEQKKTILKNSSPSNKRSSFNLYSPQP